MFAQIQTTVTLINTAKTVYKKFSPLETLFEEELALICEIAYCGVDGLLDELDTHQVQFKKAIDSISEIVNAWTPAQRARAEIVEKASLACDEYAGGTAALWVIVEELANANHINDKERLTHNLRDAAALEAALAEIKG